MALRLAWLLATLCLKKGYAYASDTYFSEAFGMQPNHIQAGLAELERAGAIVRKSVFVNGEPERRIWPSSKIIPPEVGGTPTPRSRTHSTPRSRGDRFNRIQTNAQTSPLQQHPARGRTGCRASRTALTRRGKRRRIITLSMLKQTKSLQAYPAVRSKLSWFFMNKPPPLPPSTTARAA